MDIAGSKGGLFAMSCRDSVNEKDKGHPTPVSSLSSFRSSPTVVQLPNQNRNSLTSVFFRANVFRDEGRGSPLSKTQSADAPGLFSKSEPSEAGNDTSSTSSAENTALPRPFLRCLLRFFASELIIKTIEDTCKQGHEELSIHLYNLSLASGFEKTSLHIISQVEISQTKELSLLFRVDSVATKFFQSYNLTHGHDYLHALVGTFFNFADAKLIKKLSLRTVSPALEKNEHSPPHQQQYEKEDKERAYAINVQKISVAFDIFLTLLLGSLSMIPNEIQHVTTVISRLVSHKFGSESQSVFVRGYFFLRFVCPALASPPFAALCTNSSALSPRDSGLKSFGLLISRLLQAAANGTTFQNPEMAFANEIIYETTDKIDAIVACLLGNPIPRKQEKIKEAARKTFEDRFLRYQHSCQRQSGMRTCGELARPPPLLDSIKYFNKVFEQEEELTSIVQNDFGCDSKEREAALAFIPILKREFYSAQRRITKNL